VRLAVDRGLCVYQVARDLGDGKVYEAGPARRAVQEFDGSRLRRVSLEVSLGF
jgi:hypothetical protein